MDSIQSKQRRPISQSLSSGGTKTCSKCKRVLPPTDFSRNARTSDGLRSECKRCSRLWHIENPRTPVDLDQAAIQSPTRQCCRCEQVLPRSAFSINRLCSDGLASMCKACDKQRRKEQYDPEAVRRSNLKKNHGITSETFDLMLASQGNACAICHCDKPNGHGWHVDHDHDTGKIRGILCHGCNVAIGSLKDSSRIAVAASEYLRRYGK